PNVSRGCRTYANNRRQHPPHLRHQRGAVGGSRHCHGAAKIFPADGEPSENRRSGEPICWRFSQVAGRLNREIRRLGEDLLLRVSVGLRYNKATGILRKMLRKKALEESTL